MINFKRVIIFLENLKCIVTKYFWVRKSNDPFKRVIYFLDSLKYFMIKYVVWIKNFEKKNRILLK